MGLFDRLFGKKNKNENNLVEPVLTPTEQEKVNSNNETEEFVFDTDQIVEIATENILDTNSPIAIAKFKHNLEVLIKEAKEKQKIEKFMTIRDDDNFPYDWEWRVSSNNTTLEKFSLSLSYELKKQCALEKANIKTNIDGIEIPIKADILIQAMSSVDKDLGHIYLPAKYRSTKHFTINTPLGFTGNYNGCSPDRNFTIIDSIEPFLSSGYGYSLAYQDAYQDVSHEPLPISEQAIVLIEKSKYSKLIKDPIISKQLSERRVIIYTGEEEIAINMILTELGVLPSKNNQKYFKYDEEVKDILENSVKALARKNNLLYEKSHGSIKLSPNIGHFTDYFDVKYCNQNNSGYYNDLTKFIDFLKAKFPEHEHLFSTYSVNNSYYSSEIVRQVGTQKLLEAFEEYNRIAKQQFEVRMSEYKKERKCITPEVSSFFKSTVQRINNYYETNENLTYPYEIQNQIEELIHQFLMDKSVEEQLISAKNIWNILSKTESLYQNSNLETPNIEPTGPKR